MDQITLKIIMSNNHLKSKFLSLYNIEKFIDLFYGLVFTKFLHKFSFMME